VCGGRAPVAIFDSEKVCERAGVCRWHVEMRTLQMQTIRRSAETSATAAARRDINR
jgi:hypothetical protein